MVKPKKNPGYQKIRTKLLQISRGTGSAQQSKVLSTSVLAVVVLFSGFIGLKTLRSSSALSAITEYPVPTAKSDPMDITTGPDGNLWFTEFLSGSIGKITPSGTITEYPIPPSPNGGSIWPYGITAGPDGNVWFTEGASSKIGKITPSGVITQYPLPTASGPYSIVSGPGGDLWFTEDATNKIGKITPSGVVTEYPLPESNDNPEGITVGSDGNLWFTESTINRIGKMTPTGSVTEYPIPTPDANSIDITAGPDGNLWFTENQNGKVAKITTSGVITEYNLPTDYLADPVDITAGPDGNLWFTQDESIGEITPSGTITEYPSPTTEANSNGITAGPDGNLWFSEVDGNNIGRLNLSALTAPPPPPTLPPSGSTGFEPNPDGFGFNNFGISSISKNVFEQYFGKLQTTTANGQLTAAANTYYNNVYKTAASDGLCFGFSGASAVNFSKLDQTNIGSFAMPYQSKLFTYGFLSALGLDYVEQPVKNTLGFYFGEQLGAADHKTYLSNPTVSSNLHTIMQSINNGTPISISLFSTVGKSYLGHNVLAYKYQTINNTVRVYVYDSNYSGDSSRYIIFDLAHNSWSYNLGLGFGNWSSLSNNSKMFLFPINTFTQQGTLPYFDPQSEQIVMPYVLPYVSDANGNVTGIVNGQLEEQASGVTMIPNMDAGNASATAPNQQFLTTIGQPYTMHVNNSGTQGPIDVFGNSASLTVSGITPSLNDSASITLGPDGKSVTLSAPNKVANYSVTLDQETTGKSLTFTVNGLSLSPGQTTTLSLLSNSGQLQVKNSGSNQTYTVSMQETGGTNSTLTVGNTSLGADATQTWSPTNWDNLTGAPVNLTNDADSNGKNITTTVANALHVYIDNGNPYTTSRNVTLNFDPPFTASKLRISDYPFGKNQAHYPKWQGYVSSTNYRLSGRNGKKMVYVQFEKANGTRSSVYTASIILDSLKPQITVAINHGSIITSSANVQINLDSHDSLSPIEYMKVSNTGNMDGVNWEPYHNELNWSLTPVSGILPKLRHVDVMVKDGAGNVSEASGATILVL